MRHHIRSEAAKKRHEHGAGQVPPACGDSRVHASNDSVAKLVALKFRNLRIGKLRRFRFDPRLREKS